MRVQQPTTAPTDNFALLDCTFQQGSAVSPVVDVSARPPPPRIKIASALTFSSATKAATLEHSPLRRAAPRPGARTCHYYTRPDAATFNNSAVLPPDASAPAPTFIARANLRSSTSTTTTTPYNRTVHNAAPLTNRSSAITSWCELCATLPPPEAAPVH